MLFKNKIFYILFFVFTFFNQNFAQNIDSLKTLLKVNINDSNKVKTLFELSNIYYKKYQPEEALKFAQQSKNIAQQIKYKAGEAKAFKQLGRIYQDLNDTLNTHLNFNTALKLYKELKDNNGIALVINNFGTIEAEKGNHKHALKHYFSALEYNTLTSNKNLRFGLYSNIGVAMQNVANASKDTEKFKTEMSTLTTNLTSLNSVYGAMLTAMRGGNK